VWLADSTEILSEQEHVPRKWERGRCAPGTQPGPVVGESTTATYGHGRRPPHPRPANPARARGSGHRGTDSDGGVVQPTHGTRPQARTQVEPGPAESHHARRPCWRHGTAPPHYSTIRPSLTGRSIPRSCVWIG
jgi:hypothetical protein